MSAILGIDPGLSGAVALLDHDGTLIDVWDVPHADGEIIAPELDRVIREAAFTCPDVVAWIEKVHSMPGQGVASTFRFGMAVGAIKQAVGGNGIPINYVTPQAWKKAAGLIGKDKDASRARAIELHPNHSHWFARKKDDGRAEAVLIARHGHNQGGQT